MYRLRLCLPSSPLVLYRDGISPSNSIEQFFTFLCGKFQSACEPVMLHRVVFGSIERFIGILIENYGGAFPTWLAPVQVKLLPVNLSRHLEYAKQIEKELRDLDVRVEIDDSNEKLGYKIRNAQVEKVPYSIVFGDKEVENSSLTYRVYGQKDQITVSKEEFKKLIQKHIAEKARF